jgi:hypothetical protein
MSQAAIASELAKPGRRLHWTMHLHYHVLVIDEPGVSRDCRIAFSPEILEESGERQFVRILAAIRFRACVHGAGKILLIHRDGKKVRFDLLKHLPGATLDGSAPAAQEGTEATEAETPPAGGDPAPASIRHPSPRRVPRRVRPAV